MQSGDIWKKDLGLGPYIPLLYQPHIPYACGIFGRYIIAFLKM